MAAAVLTEKCETATVIGRVYKVVHVASGKVYVRRTNAKTLGTRWHWHVHKARHATKLNSAILQAAIREFGEHAFVRSELGTAEHLEDLRALEARYISELNSLAPKGSICIQVSAGRMRRVRAAWSRVRGRSLSTRSRSKRAAICRQCDSMNEKGYCQTRKERRRARESSGSQTLCGLTSFGTCARWVCPSPTSRSTWQARALPKTKRTPSHSSTLSWLWSAGDCAPSVSSTRSC